MAETADTVSVSKAEYGTLTHIKSMMDKAWDGKDTGAAFRKMLKQANPDLKIPDDLAESAIAPVNAKVEEVEKNFKGLADRLDKFLEEAGNEKATATLRKELSEAQKKFGLDDDGMTKVMQRMKERSNPDVEAAAAFIASQAPKPKPISDHGITGSLSADLFGTTKKDDTMADLHTGGDPFRPGGFFDKTASEIINEFAQEASA